MTESCSKFMLIGLVEREKERSIESGVQNGDYERGYSAEERGVIAGTNPPKHELLFFKRHEYNDSS